MRDEDNPDFVPRNSGGVQPKIEVAPPLGSKKKKAAKKKPEPEVETSGEETVSPDE